ncbi:thioredoxin domain-containing protein [Microbacterium horticulturae]|uniref:Thioredoxin domain-containing protein n=1 Tax=Microbacterium horticulturae TaxID=3028316 RepID=A0ABY8BVH7_9MICO|nr:thioredoxin domain-containing protein [Microbacterium sp. KACC 23027]WEG08183.1 thioredoxin domain-containing protein [Microbacterium sp. KACC 23027]
MATAVRKTNWFAIWVSVIAVVVLVAVTGVVIAINNKAAAPGAAPSGGIVDTDAGAVVFGDADAPNTIETYVDFLCPYCNQFEQAEGASIKKLVDAGTAVLKVHPVTILDQGTAPAGFSSRASSAFFAIATADPDNAYAFMQAMYENQPDEQSAGLTDEQIVQIAKSAGVNVTSDLEKTITKNTYQSFAQSKGLPADATGTPHVVVNGTAVSVTYSYDTDIKAHLK